MAKDIKNIRLGLYLGVSALAAAGWVMPQAALAQDAGEDAAAADGAEDDFGVIVVTAQRREESAQDVPVALTAVSGDTLQDMGVVQIEDLSATTPGLTVSVYNPVTPQPYIRGVGTNSSSIGDDASVGLFVDDVYSGRAGGFRAAMFDIQRVEVLRGPQGTLYGRNVAGGAINFVTKDPGYDTDGYIQGTYGRFNEIEVEGGATVRLGDDAGLRLAGLYRNRDGYVRNLNTGTKLKTEDSLNLRAKLLGHMDDDTTVRVSVDYSQDENIGPSARGWVGTSDPIDGSTREVSLTTDGFSDRKVFGVSTKITHDFGPAELVSITAFRHQKYSFADDYIGTVGSTADGFPLFFGLPLVNEANETSDQFTQELRVSSTGSGPLTYTVGAYYFNEDVDRFETYDSSPSIYPGYSRPLFNGRNTSDSFSLFGQLTYAVMDNLNITLGGRNTWDRKHTIIDNQNPDLFGFLSENVYADVKFKKSQFTSKIGVDFSPMEDVMFYAGRTEGYKAGGFNGLAATQAQAEAAFRPETVTSYEAGMKSSWLDRKLRLNVAAFDMRYKDLQNFLLSGTTVTTANANARIKGVEVESQVVPVRGFSLGGSYTYLNTRYSRYENNPAFEGNRLTRAPVNAFTVFGQAKVPLDGLGELTARADYAWQGKAFLNPSNDEESALNAHGVTNVRLGIDTDSGISAHLWGRNIFDEEYRVHGFAYGFTFPIYAEPATYGVTLGYEF